MPFIVQKASDEGTSDPFYARLWAGIFELRDFVIESGLISNNIEEVRDSFDKLYKPVLEATSASRTAAKQVHQLMLDHQLKISQGTIVRFQPNAIEISESIDKPLRDEIASFLVNGVIAIKGVQEVVKLFGIDIGCLYQKPSNFEKGISELRTVGHTSLAEFLVNARADWTEQFIARRNSLEHKGWTLPKIQYRSIFPDKVELLEPKVDGLPVSIYCNKMLTRIISFVENIVVYAFKSALKVPAVIVEIPNTERELVCPKRFRLDIKRSGSLEWDIKYSEVDFP